jgi:hypothetical protein
MSKTLCRIRMWIGTVFIPVPYRYQSEYGRYHNGKSDFGSGSASTRCRPTTLEPTHTPVVRSHAAVDHADVVGDLFNLAGGLVLEQDGLVLLFSGQHHSVHGLDKRH